jgi:hypothetical protein
MEYQVKSEHQSIQADSLDHAMTIAKELAVFVTISGADFELCGIFGTAAVEKGLLPDGTNYEWKKRRS